MNQFSNELDTIKQKRNFSYAKAVPTFVSNSVGIPDEIARWVLDRNAILYKEQMHAPCFIQKKINTLIDKDGTDHGPVLQMTDAFIYNAESIVRFWEQRCTVQNRLLPDDQTKQAEVLDLFQFFTGEFCETRVTKYFYANMLGSKNFAIPVFTSGVPFFEKLSYWLGYPFIKKTIIQEYNLANTRSEDSLELIRKAFAKVDGILSDGRRYLTGNMFTLADLSFAAITAPMILPVEFGGVLPDISQVPDAYRKEVVALRASPAGLFVTRIYQENRPVSLAASGIPKEPGFLGKCINRILISLKKKQSGLFYSLQKTFPVLKIPMAKIVLVTQHRLLTELLNRNLDFTIEEINSKKMSNQKGAFFLGMDSNNEQYIREIDFVRNAVKRNDLEWIRQFVRDASDHILRHAKPYGKLDVANSYCKVILVRLIDEYFGVSSPTETIMKDWLRVLFYDLFLNFLDNKTKHQTALKAANKRRDWLLQIIKERKQELEAGKKLKDNLLNRLILMGQDPKYSWVDDDTIQRNIGGLMTGILETTNKSLVLILDELFNRPEVFASAVDVANSGDTKKMYGYVKEAMRFNPTQPGVIRYAEKTNTLTGKNSKVYTIPAKRKILALISSAMFDPDAIPEPKKFIADRTVEYMNFGYGLHECFGRYINEVTLTEFTMAILRLKDLSRVPGRCGRGTGITIASFPNNFVVRFN
jgi:cytochrome P450/glutathione S-transferase